MGKTNIKGFSVDTSFNPHEHAPRTGRVVAVPDHLEFSTTTTKYMPWETKMEILVGDEVTYHYLDALLAESKIEGTCIIVDGEKYYFIPYDRIFTAKRPSDYVTQRRFKATEFDMVVICLNGYTLIEPVKDREMERYKEFLEVPQKLDMYFGIVNNCGSLITHYGKMDHKFNGPDEDNIEIGDLVVMDKNCAIPLEYNFHSTMEDRKLYFRVQRRYIIGVMDK